MSQSADDSFLPPDSDSDTATASNVETEADDDDDHDHESGRNHSRRKAFHDDQETCAFLLGNAASAIPLKIAPSSITKSGSGLFVGEDLDEGQEIFRLRPLCISVDPSRQDICNFCFEDAGNSAEPGTVSSDTHTDSKKTKACLGCETARFCSKDCHKRAWKQFHKAECKVLKESEGMQAPHRLLYHILFQHKRGRLSGEVGEALKLLEDHFLNYSTSLVTSDNMLNSAVSIRQITGTKLSLKTVWRLLPAIRVNAMEITSAGKRDPCAVVLDPLISIINHSCDPNAFCFLENGQIRLRSLKRVQGGDEITVSYTAPNTDVAARREFLGARHFFCCNCARCVAEARELNNLMDQDTKQLEKYRTSLKDITDLIGKANSAPRDSSLRSPHQDAELLEGGLRTLAHGVFPGGCWPDHIEPLPSARMALASLYKYQDGYVGAALRNALKGALMSPRRSGPNWANDLYELCLILTAAGSTDTIFADNVMFPSPKELTRLTAGFWAELAREANMIFGDDCQFAREISKLYSLILEAVSDPKPGAKEFSEEFDKAQARLLAWAGIDSSFGIGLENTE